MKIAIEAMGIHYFGGGRTATLNLLQALLAMDRDNEYVLFLNQSEPELMAGNVRQRIVPIKNRFAARIWSQLQLPLLVRNCDLTHFVKDLGLFGLPTRTIITVFDMATLIYPDLYPQFDVWYWRHVQKRTLVAARQVIAISRQTAEDLRRFYGLPQEQITVIYPACGRHFEPASTVSIDKIRRLYRLPAEYILHVGRLDPKKNIPMLIEAFGRFRQHEGFPGTLVLVGEPYKKRPDRSIYRLIEQLGLEEVVQLVGAVPDKDLPAIYSGATLVIVPSLYEGFGLVALEAMSSGAPLIVNKAGAVVEVVGDAAEIIPESSADCLAEFMSKLWRDESHRRTLRQKGLQRARLFSWEKMARQTLQLYNEVVTQ